MSKVKYNVRITNNYRFRAEIKKVNEQPFQITVGGNSWRQNTIDENLKIQILKTCNNIMSKLSKELNNAMQNEIETS